jgi:hypothetical protein
MTRAPDFDEEMARLQDHMPDWAAPAAGPRAAFHQP